MLKEINGICTIIENNKATFKAIAKNNIESTLGVNSMFKVIGVYVKTYYDMLDCEEKVYLQVKLDNINLLSITVGNCKTSVTYDTQYNDALIQALFRDVLNYLKSMVASGV